MDGLTAFGATSVAAMLLFYVLDSRWSAAPLAFALACWASAVYAWLAGTWPFAIIEGIWGVFALGRFLSRIRVG